ncbi:hypothetical protein ANN_10072 [Periplaneta americana]|uniref:Uncharacterized protein n=1 Tax=Periplaneta americana TaxID=6978 RepID=A0ABQ8TN51_PERAM|nr:hypothetical protein ANN_10072 [Periplaneta americana]
MRHRYELAFMQGSSLRRQNKERPLFQISRKNYAQTDREEEKDLIGSLAKKRLLTEGCTGRNSKQEKSSGQMKSDLDNSKILRGSYANCGGEEKGKKKDDWRTRDLQ